MDVTPHLPEIAESLSRKAQKARLSSQDLREECPWLTRQIVEDAATPGLFDFWGCSSNFDELAKVSIVEPGVLVAIGELAGVPVADPIVHAGLQHTYGYLLSTVVTPYGYKRDRWVSPQLEQGFGLHSDLLGPNPSEGTLLANATFFSGQIAFRGDENAMQGLRRISGATAASLRKRDLKQITQSRIVESLLVRDSAGRFRSVRIRTDLVPFPHHVEDCVENCLLVYSIEDSATAGVRLITLFPVGPAFVEEMLDPGRFGPTVEIRIRFNAFVPNLPEQMLIGRRTLEQISS